MTPFVFVHLTFWGLQAIIRLLGVASWLADWLGVDREKGMRKNEFRTTGNSFTLLSIYSRPLHTPPASHMAHPYMHMLHPVAWRAHSDVDSTDGLTKLCKGHPLSSLLLSVAVALKHTHHQRPSSSSLLIKGDSQWQSVDRVAEGSDHIRKGTFMNN